MNTMGLYTFAETDTSDNDNVGVTFMYYRYESKAGPQIATADDACAQNNNSNSHYLCYVKAYCMMLRTTHLLLPCV